MMEGRKEGMMEGRKDRKKNACDWPRKEGRKAGRYSSKSSRVYGKQLPRCWRIMLTDIHTPSRVEDPMSNVMNICVLLNHRIKPSTNSSKKGEIDEREVNPHTLGSPAIAYRHH